MNPRIEIIKEIGIDSLERLFIKPEKEKFTMIYRSATEVHWDVTAGYLYSPKPREWSYLKWFHHITSVILTECNMILTITEDTTWSNINYTLKEQNLSVK